MASAAPYLDPAVIEAASGLITPGRRVMLGIVGAPAAGKSTGAALLIEALSGAAVGLPMDGFHLSQAVLNTLGRADRKGAPDTFDARGYRHMLTRARDAFASDETVYAPDFHRDIEEPVAAGIAVAPDVPLVIAEGNYLLLDEAPWPDIAATLDTIWAITIDDAQREAWLLERHVHHGRSPEAARDWIAGTDRPNATRISQRLDQADRQLVWRDGALCFNV